MPKKGRRESLLRFDDKEDDIHEELQRRASVKASAVEEASRVRRASIREEAAALAKLREEESLKAQAELQEEAARRASTESADGQPTYLKLLDGEIRRVSIYEKFDDDFDIDHVRGQLSDSNEMALGHLIWAALEHACDGVTHSDAKFSKLYNKLTSKETWSSAYEVLRDLSREVVEWMKENWIKSILMFIGFGGTVFKAKTIKGLITVMADDFINWGLSTNFVLRFIGFVVLMMVRLIVSTLVPPTSPAFGIILQAATPESEKWTAIPAFLLASTVAGAAPYLLDKAIELCVREDFVYTMFAKRFADFWPLTCWTGPAMVKIFNAAGGGKMGSSLAVIFAHAAPFMGAQTTNLQRYFLPHPLDTILSQPFGMSEDLLGIALAEATTNPILGSVSLTVLVVFFNVMQYVVFTRKMDFQALIVSIGNFIVGLVIVIMIMGLEAQPGAATVMLVCVAMQCMIQIILTPLLTSCIISEPFNDKLGI